VLPGQTITTAMWRLDDRMVLRATVNGATVFTNASIG
jgi:hypothetical protein